MWQELKPIVLAGASSSPPQEPLGKKRTKRKDDEIEMDSLLLSNHE
jgi:hypothetical protein